MSKNGLENNLYTYDQVIGIFGGVLAESLKKLDKLQPMEIVRCKDCKHRYVDGTQVVFNCCELNHNKVQSDDWFCADGERKEQ